MKLAATTQLLLCDLYSKRALFLQGSAPLMNWRYCEIEPSQGQQHYVGKICSI